MSVITKKDFKDLSPLSIDLTNLLEVYEVEVSTLNDIYFGLKLANTDADDFKMFKTLVIDVGDLTNYPGGLTVVNNIIIVPFLLTDWGKLLADTEYIMCLAIKREVGGWFEEVRFINNGTADEQAKIKILQDKVRR